MKTLATWLLLLLALAGTARPAAPRFGGLPSVPDGKALVFIFYARGALMSRPAQELFANGEKMIRIQSGGYYVYEAVPGALVLSDGPDAGTGAARVSKTRNGTTLELEVAAGSISYVEWAYAPGIPHGSGRFQRATRAHALDLIVDCIQLEPPGGGGPAEAAAPAAPSRYDAALVTQARTRYDSVLTTDCAIVAATEAEKAEVDGLIAFLKEQKENRDFDQIARIEFAGAERAKIVFTWYRGQHVGSLAAVKGPEGWKITGESHSI
jgi:hypothetical protein